MNSGLDRLQDTLNVLKNIVVPESQDAISDFRKSAISYCVCVGFAMLAAVRFFNYFQFAAEEIANVPINRLLTNKLGAGDLSIPQVKP